MSYSINEGSEKAIAADVVGSPHNPTTDEQVPFVCIATGPLGAAAAATLTNPLPVQGVVPKSITVTPTLDTNAYASGDLYFGPTVITDAARSSGGTTKLVSLTIIDEDAQGADFVIYVTTDNTSWGTLNATPTVTDAVLRNVKAVIPVAASDFKTVNGAKLAQVEIKQTVIQAVGSANLYAAAVVAATPTNTAGGVKLYFGFEQ